MEKTDKKEGRGEAFVLHVLGRMEIDHGLGAALRRADNPATEYQSWEHLERWVDLSDERQRLSFITVGAALARAKPGHDGAAGLGKALASCYDDEAESDQARAKLRRILACETLEELAGVLRPLLSLVASKAKQPLSYGLLLQDLLGFGFDPQRLRIRWARDFYGRWVEE